MLNIFALSNILGSIETRIDLFWGLENYKALVAASILF